MLTETEIKMILNKDQIRTLLNALAKNLPLGLRPERREIAGSGNPKTNAALLMDKLITEVEVNHIDAGLEPPRALRAFQHAAIIGERPHLLDGLEKFRARVNGETVIKGRKQRHEPNGRAVPYGPFVVLS